MSAINKQADAIQFIERVLQTYNRSRAHIRPHFLVSGSSGTGKSYLLETAAKAFGFNFLNINAAQLTREGISGNSLSKALVPLQQLQNKPVIILFDEFDKLFLTGNGLTGDERSGVQSEILHIISSKVAAVVGEYGKAPQVSTARVLFIFAGAFAGMDNLSPAKLMRMGMLPELLGRVNLHVHLADIPKNELIDAVPTEPLFEQYCTLAKADELHIAKYCKAIQAEIEKQFTANCIGYRLVHRLIHQYFLYQGKFPVYKEEDLSDVALYNAADADDEEDAVVVFDKE